MSREIKSYYKMKSKLISIIFILICRIGFSQNIEYPITVFIGDSKCVDEIELNRTQLINAGKLSVIANSNDTLTEVSFTMQASIGDELTPKYLAKSPSFTADMIKIINKSDKTNKKIWIEKITVKYKEEIIKLPDFRIRIKD